MHSSFHLRRASDEFRSGKLDVDLWLDALGRAGGREKEAERIYVRLRAEQLRSRGLHGTTEYMGMRVGELIRPSRFLWLYPLVFLVAGLLLFALAVTGTLNPNAVPSGPRARVIMAVLGLALAGLGAWSLRAARRAVRQAQNMES